MVSNDGYKDKNPLSEIWFSMVFNMNHKGMYLIDLNELVIWTDSVTIMEQS